MLVAWSPPPLWTSLCLALLGLVGGRVVRDAAPPLPVYALELQGDEGAPAAGPDRARVTGDSTLSVCLRPQRPVRGPVSVRAYLHHEGEGRGAEPWPVRLEPSPAGTLWLRAPVSALPALRPGRSRVVFLLGAANSTQVQTGVIELR